MSSDQRNHNAKRCVFSTSYASIFSELTSLLCCLNFSIRTTCFGDLVGRVRYCAGSVHTSSIMSVILLAAWSGSMERVFDTYPSDLTRQRGTKSAQRWSQWARSCHWLRQAQTAAMRAFLPFPASARFLRLQTAYRSRGGKEGFRCCQTNAHKFQIVGAAES